MVGPVKKVSVPGAPVEAAGRSVKLPDRSVRRDGVG